MSGLKPDSLIVQVALTMLPLAMALGCQARLPPLVSWDQSQGLGTRQAAWVLPVHPTTFGPLSLS